MRETIAAWITQERSRTQVGRALAANEDNVSVAVQAGDWDALGGMFNFLSVEVNMLQGIVTILGAEVDRLAGRS